MSKEAKDQNNKNEEVDLLVLFNYIGDKFNQLFGLITKFFKYIYSIFILAAKVILTNIKIISIVLIICGAVGFFLESSRVKKYESGMLFRTYFGSKYQLATNMNYYNALIENEDFETLSYIFDIPKDTIAKVTNFEMAIGPETENERIKAYDQFVRSIDSIRAQDISYDDYIENRDEYSGNLFYIRVESTKRDIFKSLEPGINRSFDNLYSIDKMKKRDSMIVLRKENIMSSIREIDSLKKVYIKVIQQESEFTPSNVSLGEGFPMVQEKSETKEFQLLNKEIELRNSLRALEEEKLEENVFFDVISSFQVVGNEVKNWQDRYTIVFPILGFILLSFAYLLRQFAIYVKKYEV